MYLPCALEKFVIVLWSDAPLYDTMMEAFTLRVVLSFTKFKVLREYFIVNFIFVCVSNSNFR